MTELTLEQKVKRKEVRYLLRRIKTQVEGGPKAPRLPKGFKKGFESQDKFRGWINYQVIWDVYPEDPYTICFLEKSLDEQWNDTLMEKVPVLPDGKQSNSKSSN